MSTPTAFPTGYYAVCGLDCLDVDDDLVAAG
jgi:hypothetical protein